MLWNMKGNVKIQLSVLIVTNNSRSKTGSNGWVKVFLWSDKNHSMWATHYKYDIKIAIIATYIIEIVSNWITKWYLEFLIENDVPYLKLSLEDES